MDLEFTKVRAPIDGRVSRALLTEGNYVSGLAGSASLLTTLVSVNPVYVYADMDEDSLLKFNDLVAANKMEKNADGKIPVQLQLADETNFPHEGYIESFDNHVNPQDRQHSVARGFSEHDDQILPGLFARIRVPLSEKHEALLVDEKAIGTDQAQKYVLTLTPTNTVAYQTVSWDRPLTASASSVRLEGGRTNRRQRAATRAPRHAGDSQETTRSADRSPKSHKAGNCRALIRRPLNSRSFQIQSAIQ